MGVKHLSDSNPDGTVLGQDTADKIAFYGVTPVAQPAATAQSAVATTALTTITDIVTTASLTGAFNSVVARVTALITLTNSLREELVDLGLIKGSN